MRQVRVLATLQATLVFVLFWSSSVAAQATVADRAAAEVLFDQAIKLLEEGKAEQACPKLEESQRLDPGVGTLLYLADCYKTVGRTASAWATFREASYAAAAAGQSDRQGIASAEAEKLKPLLSYVVLAVADKGLDGLTIKRDGEVIRSVLWGTPLPIDPGEHQVEASAPGRRPWSQNVSVPKTPGTTDVQIPPLEVEPAPPAAPIPSSAPAPAAPRAAASPEPVNAARPGEPQQDRGSGSSMSTLGWVALGVGGVGIAVGSVFGVLASKDNRDADAACRPDAPERCSAEGVSLAESARSKAMLSTLGFGVGLTAAAAGVVLILAAPEDATAEHQQLRLGSVGMSNGLGIVAEGTF